MVKAVIVDPGLTKRIGHNYQMAARLPANLARAGYECRIISHKTAVGELEPELARDAVFSQSHYMNISQDPLSGELEDFLWGGKGMSVDLAGITDLKLENRDLVFLPTAGPRAVWGVAQYLKESNQRPLVALLFHMTEPRQSTIDNGSVTCAVHRLAARALVAVVGKNRVLWGVTNDYLGRKLAPALGHETTTLPVPVWYPKPAGPAPAATQEPVIAFLGHMKDIHGFEVLPDIARALKARVPRAQVRIHVGAITHNLAVKFAPYRALQEEGIAEIIEGWIDDAAMGDLYRSATVLAMPYSRNAYREMVSAVLSTAIALGKPCVVPSDTWLADQVSAGRASGVVYTGEETTAVVDAICEVLADCDRHAREAAALAEPWRRTQSGRALAKSLVEWHRVNARRQVVT